jgi:hypothetical protein
LSRADKSITRCTIDIDIDPKTQLPRGIQMKVLTGVRGSTSEGSKDKALGGGVEHVAFHFDYSIDPNHDVAKFQIPKEAAKLMK